MRDNRDPAARQSSAATAPLAFVASVHAGAPQPGFADGPGNQARFGAITALDGDGAGNLYVADAGNRRIRKVDGRGRVTTLAGTGETAVRDGPALLAAFRDLRDLGVDGSGNCYVIDGEDLRHLSTQGVVSTLGPIAMPTGEHSYTNYTGPVWDRYLETCWAEEFFQAHDLTVSPAGDVWVVGSATRTVTSLSLKWGMSGHRGRVRPDLRVRPGGRTKSRHQPGRFA